jgi:sirohydrochlorin cobaltochelatase
MTSGLLLFAHGARDPQWAEPFQAVLQQVAVARPDIQVALAFLEFMAPDLATAGTALAEQGCTHVIVVPLFLGAGGHVRNDLPVLLGSLRAEHPHIDWQLRSAIGEMPEVVQAMAEAALSHFDC